MEPRNPPTTLRIDIESWPMAVPVRITGYVMETVQVLVATLSDGTHYGRGEAAGVYYKGDAPNTMAAQIEAVRAEIESGISREALRALLPPGGARNAIDCALWELASRRARTPVWALLGQAAPQPMLTTYTIGADTPEAMAQTARGRYRDARAIKLKLLGDGEDGARVRAVREARPDVWLGVDGNQGLDITSLKALLPGFVAARVALIEQPGKVGHEAELDGLASPIPLAADESVQSLEDLPGLLGRFQVINIKLDKCGGLTEALLMVEEAKRLGLRVMVGNMGGTTLAMAPAAAVGAYCEVVDLDGPLFLKADRPPTARYERGLLSVPAAAWGWVD